MSANNSGSGGVRNLRAMFENKTSDHSTSPPSRGRSPNDSEISGNSRPVSKVRTSFVAVERPGEAGLANQWRLRKASDVSSMAEVKENVTSNPESMQRSPESATTTENLTNASIPMSPHMSKESIVGGLGTILKGSSFEPTGSAKSASNTKAKKGVKEPPKPSAKPMSTKQQEPVPKSSTTGPVKPPQSPTTKQTQQKPKSPNLSKQSPKTPTSPSASVQRHIRGGPAKVRGVMESASKAREARESAVTQESVRAPEKQVQITPTEPETNGVKKDVLTSPKTKTQPKSPAKPARLPSAATATTAASAARTDGQAQAQVEAERRKSMSRRRSTVSLKNQRVTESAPTSTIVKKASRASLVNGHDRPRSRVSTTTKADDGFLARMTRPTASSTYKTHDKLLVTSPPRTNNAPASKGKDLTKPKAAPPKMNLKGASGADGNEDKENSALGNHDGEQNSPLEAVHENPQADEHAQQNTSTEAKQAMAPGLVNGTSTEA